MTQYTLHDAQDQLQHLINEAQDGKKVLILDEHNRAVQLVPIPQPKKSRQAGSARGLVKMADDFDAPLSDFDAYME